MKIWFTADQHFGQMHGIKHAHRPFKTPQQQDKRIIKAWNKHVKDEDTVIVLGDFAKEKPAFYASQLKGRIIIVPGNHDKWKKKPDELKRLKAINVKVISEEFLLTKINGIAIYMRHKPLNYKNCDVMLHGHVHGKGANKGKKYDVGVDAHKFSPVALRVIIATKGV